MKKSKHEGQTDMHACFAQLHIHNHGEEVVTAESGEGTPLVLDAQEMIVEEENISLVRRRFLHLKRVARSPKLRRRRAEFFNQVQDLSMDTTAEASIDAGVAGDNLPQVHQ